MKRKKTLQQVGYVLVLLAAIIILFQRYTTQNRVRIEQRNKNYAADAAHLKAEQIDGELTNALGRINTYAYFLGEGGERYIRRHPLHGCPGDRPRLRRESLRCIGARLLHRGHAGKERHGDHLRSPSFR